MLSPRPAPTERAQLADQLEGVAIGREWRSVWHDGRVSGGSRNPESHSWPSDLDVHMVLLSRDQWAKTLAEAGYTVDESFFCADPRDPEAAPSLALRASR